MTHYEQISLLTNENQMLRDTCRSKEATLSSQLSIAEENLRASRKQADASAQKVISATKKMVSSTPTTHTLGWASAAGGCAAGSNPGGAAHFEISDPDDVDLEDVSMGQDPPPETDWSKKFDKRFDDVLHFMHSALAEIAIR